MQTLVHSPLRAKKLRPALAAACTLAAATFLHAQTTWTGAVDNELLNAGNWSNGLPDNTTNPGAISGGTPTWTTTNINGKQITQTAGTMTADATTTNLTIQSGGAGLSTWNLNGGIFDILSGSTNVRLGDGGTLNVNGGTLTSSGAGVLWLNHANAFVNIQQNTTTNVAISNRFGVFTVDNAAFQIGNFTLGANASSALLTLQNGASMDVTTAFSSLGANKTVSFASGVNAFSAAAWSGNGLSTTTFDFASSGAGSTITISASAWDAAAWETKWSEGLLTVDGVNTGAFGDYFTVSGDTLTFVGAIPEPSAFAGLLGLAGLGSALASRRRRA